MPTVRELGLAGIEAVGFQGLVGPAGMPKELVERLAAEVEKVVASAGVREKLQGAGAEPRYRGPVEFTAFVKAENDKWARLIRERKLHAD